MRPRQPDLPGQPVDGRLLRVAFLHDPQGPPYAEIVELEADADLYSAEQAAKARRVQADAEAYATGVVAEAIQKNGLEAAQYQVALKQVEALNALGGSEGSSTVVVPANALEAFGNAFNMLKGRS